MAGLEAMDVALASLSKAFSSPLAILFQIQVQISFLKFVQLFGDLASTLSYNKLIN